MFSFTRSAYVRGEELVGGTHFSCLLSAPASNSLLRVLRAISQETFQTHSPSPRSYSPTISVPPVTPLIAHCISGLFSWRVDEEHSLAHSGSPIHICLLVQEFPGPLPRRADRPGNCFFLLSRSHLFGIGLFCTLGTQQECCQLSGLRKLVRCRHRMVVSGQC